jgi:hypothetical protein
MLMSKGDRSHHVSAAPPGLKQFYIAPKRAALVTEMPLGAFSENQRSLLRSYARERAR